MAPETSNNAQNERGAGPSSQTNVPAPVTANAAPAFMVMMMPIPYHNPSAFTNNNLAMAAYGSQQQQPQQPTPLANFAMLPGVFPFPNAMLPWPYAPQTAALDGNAILSQQVNNSASVSPPPLDDGSTTLPSKIPTDDQLDVGGRWKRGSVRSAPIALPSTYQDKDFKFSFHPSSMTDTFALEPNFPPAGAVFGRGRMEATCLKNIMEHRRNNKITIISDPNKLTYRCQGTVPEPCGGKMILPKQPTEDGTMMVSESTPCKCSLVTPFENPEHLFSSMPIEQFKSAVVTHIMVKEKIPLAAVHRSLPPKQKEKWTSQLVGKECICFKRLDGRFFFLFCQRKHGQYVLCPFTREDIETQSWGYEEGWCFVCEEVHERCMVCDTCTKKNVYKFNCNNCLSNDSVYCKDCIETKAYSRPAQTVPIDGQEMKLENTWKTVHCPTCQRTCKSYFRKGTNPSADFVRFKIPLCWMYQVPFFDEMEAKQYGLLFSTRVGCFHSQATHIYNDLCKVDKQIQDTTKDIAKLETRIAEGEIQHDQLAQQQGRKKRPRDQFEDNGYWKSEQELGKLYENLQEWEEEVTMKKNELDGLEAKQSNLAADLEATKKKIPDWAKDASRKKTNMPDPSIDSQADWWKDLTEGRARSG